MTATATTFLEEPGPCDNCNLARMCKARSLACADFWVDVERANSPRIIRNKSLRHPTREVFDFLFSGIDYINTGRLDTKGRVIYSEPPELRRLRIEALGSLPTKGRRLGVAA